MPTTTLSPNVTHDTGGETATGAASLHAALADESDASYVSVYFTTSLLGLTDFSLPAGAVAYQFRAVVRSRDDMAGAPDGFNGGVRIRLYSDTGFSVTLLNEAGPFHTDNVATWVDWNSNWVEAYLTQAVVNSLAARFLPVSTGRAQMSRLRFEVKYANPPGTPTFGAPSGAVTTTRRPLIDWNFVQGTDGPATQSGFRVKIFSQAQYQAGGFDPETSYPTVDSGYYSVSDTYWSPTSDLANGVTYRAYVKTYATQTGAQQESAWGYTQFNIAIPVPTPTLLTPGHGTTATISRPAVGASVAAMTDGIFVRRQWDIASDSGFTTNLQTVDTDTLGASKSGTVEFPAGLNRLPQGTWYIRVRAIDQYGVPGSYTSTNTFTVAHAPSTSNRQPSGATSLIYDTINNDVDVSWLFSDLDPADYQTRYQGELWKLSDPGNKIVIASTASTNQYMTFTGLNATWKDTELRWRVQVADQDTVWSGWSPDQSFYLRDVPVPTITSPVNASEITSSAPLIEWTFSASGGRTQASYRVIVTNTDSSTVVADSGVLSGANLSWQVPTPVVLVGPNYSVQVIVVDSTGLTGTDTNTFTADYAAPTTPTFTLDGTEYNDTGRVVVDWSAAAADATLVAWRIYRRIYGEVAWTLVHEADPTDRNYFDYLCPSQTLVEYSVVQVALSFGEPVESGYPVQQFEATSEHYFLVVPEFDTLNLRLDHVTGESFSDEQEMATVNLIGRGRRVEYGTRYGQSGTLDGAFYDNPEMSARQQRLWLEAIRDAGMKTYLRTPFGDVWAVAMPSCQITRIAGTGTVERSTFSLTYFEITA